MILQTYSFMKYFTNKMVILFIFALYCICSCQRANTVIDEALVLAGDNRKELEQVLKHYKNDPLKFQAACFLIANMPLHYSYNSWQIDSMKAIKKESIIKGRLSDSIVSRWNTYNYAESPKIYDIQNVSAKFLIEEIDYAFKAWSNKKWSKKYSFTDFCKYVLPYRIDDEPLSPWRKKFYLKYNHILDSLYQGNDAVEAARHLARFLKEEGFITREDFNLPHLGGDFLFCNRIGSCLDQCDVAIYVMRAVGIPIALDFYKISPSYNSTHYWTSIIDTTHLAVPFNYNEKDISRKYRLDRKLGKVYRIDYDYSFNSQHEKEKNLVQFDKPVIRDVSYEYFPKSYVTLSANKFPDRVTTLYLSIYTGRRFCPIAFSVNNGKNFLFTFLEQNLIYYPAAQEGEKQRPIYYPFLLRNNKAQYFVPDKKRLFSAKLTRKYPVLKRRNFIKNLVGIQIWGYSHKYDKDSILLFHCRQSPKKNYIVITLQSKKEIQIIKYIAPAHKQIELGEFYAFNNKDTLIPQQTSSLYPLDDVQKRDLKHIADGKWETFYMSTKKGDGLIFDYGKARRITKLLIVPRNDDNYIHPGDFYELFFHDGANGWISLGEKVATTNFLIYKNIPQNSILWLHNRTRGIEERPFYYKAGKQYFP